LNYRNARTRDIINFAHKLYFRDMADIRMLCFCEVNNSKYVDITGCYGVTEIQSSKQGWRCTRCVKQMLSAVSY